MTNATRELGAPREREDARALEASSGSGEARAPEDDGLRFDDPYWDDAFCAWWDPALRTCCG